ncbi:MAG: hypothetical protein HDR88_03005 [Bacteroides sp.]|nr:hypothetical protein [Bacteroides sp.]
MKFLNFLFLFITFFISDIEGQVRNIIIADSLTHMPLVNASIFNCKGSIIGTTGLNGVIPKINSSDYPIAVRYMGFNEKIISDCLEDTVFLQENPIELPEIIVESRNHKILHILAYIREYSTLTTYTDTVFLFREKLVDYMLNSDKRSSFRGWSTPRIIKVKSYYHFTNNQGLDSVSDESNHHFSWSDWLGIDSSECLPTKLSKVERGSDTIMGKYSPAEIWIKNADRVTVDVNVLADIRSRKWVSNFSGFFQKDLDFDLFKIKYNYDNVLTDSVYPKDLIGYSFNIASQGRGHNMFRFNKKEEPFFVNTLAEVYMLDKEYITIKEAKKWAKQKFDTIELDIYQPHDVPKINPSILTLIDRVNKLDKGGIRLSLEPDQYLGSIDGLNTNYSFGNRLLFMLKDLTGISLYKSRKNSKRKWNNFREKRREKNKSITE